MLEYHAVPNWQKVVDHLLADKEMLEGVRLTIEIEESSDPSAALEVFLGKIPAQNKDVVVLDGYQRDLLNRTGLRKLRRICEPIGLLGSYSSASDLVLKPVHKSRVCPLRNQVIPRFYRAFSARLTK